MKRKHIGVILLVLALVNGSLMNCETNKCASQHELIDFNIVDSIDIPISGRQYKHITPVLYETDTLTLLAGLDSDNPGIDLFNLNEKIFYKRIELQKHGPNSVIDPRALVIHNLDSIFILNDDNQLYLLNQYGKKRNQWNLSLPLPDSILKIDKSMTGEYMVAAYGKSEYLNLPFIYKSSEKSIIARLIPLNSADGSAEYSILYRGPNMIQIDLVLGRIKKLYGKYPTEFLIDPKPHNPFAHFISFKNSTWIQFDSSHEIYWVEKDSFLCTSTKFSKKEITKFRNDQTFDEEKEIRSYHTDEAYLGIYYDPYNQLIYRVFQHNQPDKDLDGKLNQKLQAKFSILIIDLTGKIVGEVLFDEGKYNFLDIFVTRQGLLISKENSFNKKNVEELYSFDLIKFKL